MALFEGQTAATRRKRVQEEWLRFCLHMGFSTGFSHIVFPSVCGLRVMANAFLPIQPDVTSMEHVLG